MIRNQSTFEDQFKDQFKDQDSKSKLKFIASKEKPETEALGAQARALDCWDQIVHSEILQLAKHRW